VKRGIEERKLAPMNEREFGSVLSLMLRGLVFLELLFSIPIIYLSIYLSISLYRYIYTCVQIIQLIN
jgi:hypothetical protein